jgi:hypothetical protein
MTWSFSDTLGSFVVVFFRTKAGELHCRVTEVGTRETWIVRSATELRRLLVEQRSASKGGGGSP